MVEIKLTRDIPSKAPVTIPKKTGNVSQQNQDIESWTEKPGNTALYARVLNAMPLIRLFEV